MKKLSRERVRLAIEKKRIDDKLEALLDKIAPELDASIREQYRDDPVKLAEWEAEWALINPATPPRPKARRAELPKKEES
jgi:hypothetical protein